MSAPAAPVLYNENAPFAAEWLRNLVAAGHIAPGTVDDRSIHDLTGADLAGYTQVHLFAGIGGWSLALRLAGWPDDRPVWSGSCPCQPFSVAGKGRGTDDPRHLWPEMRRLISECRPATVIGEQVASAAGRAWLAGVRADLEALGYAVGAADLCAAGIGAPHIRQRLYWVADADAAGLLDEQQPAQRRGASTTPECRRPGWLADAEDADGRAGECGAQAGVGADGERRRRPAGGGDLGGVGDADGERLREPEPAGAENGERGGGQPLPAGGQWGSHFLACADGTARRVEPGLSPVAHGLPRSVGDLRTGLPGVDAGAVLRGARRYRRGTLSGYGNAIVPQLAAEFIRAYMEAPQ